MEWTETKGINDIIMDLGALDNRMNELEQSLSNIEARLLSFMKETKSQIAQIRERVADTVVKAQ